MSIVGVVDFTFIEDFKGKFSSKVDVHLTI